MHLLWHGMFCHFQVSLSLLFLVLGPGTILHIINIDFRIACNDFLAYDCVCVDVANVPKIGCCLTRPAVFRIA